MFGALLVASIIKIVHTISSTLNKNGYEPKWL